MMMVMLLRFTVKIITIYNNYYGGNDNVDDGDAVGVYNENNYNVDNNMHMQRVSAAETNTVTFLLRTMTHREGSGMGVVVMMILRTLVFMIFCANFERISQCMLVGR